MGWQAWLTGGLIVAMFGALATGRFGTDIVMLGVLAVLLLAGVVTPAEAFGGFANTGLLTVAFLYVVATGLQQTGAMGLLGSRLLGRPRTALGAQARLVGPVTVLSAFLNNTPLVAAFMPAVRDWSRRTGVPASLLFMPLSFAAILGGVCTLIGTSTNLVVYSLIEGYNGVHPGAPLPQLGMWTLSWVGVPVAVAGGVYILVFGRRLLPSRAVEAGAPGERRQYMTAMKPTAGSPVIGATIESAGLRHLPGLFLSRIDRGGEAIAAVSPEETIRAGDVLVFVGNLESVVDLQRVKGLAPVTDEAGPSHYRPGMRLVEAVISPSSPLVGLSIRDAQVRTRYGAVVVAVHRLGQRLGGRIGDIVLRAGDTLLLEADAGFARRFRQSTSFYLVSELEGPAAPRYERAWVSLGVLAGLVAVMSAGRLPVIGAVPEVVAAMVAAGAMIACRCCTGPQARAGIEWPVLIVIGASFGLGRALETTGLAGAAAAAVTGAAGAYGPWAMLGAVYAITLAFTTLISNNAAAALMFPIVVSVSHAAGHSFTPYAVCVALGASCEFMTPLGYQTNLMVMGPGGYRWADYFRFGGPLTVLAGAVAVGLIPLVYGPI